MLIVVKILLVAFAVFGQAKLFQEKPQVAAVEGGLDSLVLPDDKPELALAKRAMEAQGLCSANPAGPAHAEKHAAVPFDTSSGAVQDADEARDSRNALANNCF